MTVIKDIFTAAPYADPDVIAITAENNAKHAEKHEGVHLQISQTPGLTYEQEIELHKAAGVYVYPDEETGSAPDIALRDLLRIVVSRSAVRTSGVLLEGAQLDADKLYAIFIPDSPSLEITSIEFLLDGSPVHTEASTPWDYDGTQFDGSASRVTFVAGEYIVTANITDVFGTFSIDAAFNVD